MKIGIAGLGRMGGAIAKRLIDVGHNVAVWNRDPTKSKPLGEQGAVLAASPKELAERVDLVITILTDAAAIESVYNGSAGLLAGDVAGKLFVEMSTVQPETERLLARQVRDRQGALLECPVGGTVGPALNGKLLGFAGGTKEDFDHAKPVLDQLCRRVDHVGPVGAGSSMKLAINLPLAVFWQSFGEAFALVQHLGLDTSVLVEMFTESSGGPNVLKARGSAVAKALRLENSGSATFDCDSIRKDLRTMIAEGKDLGFALPLAQQTLGVFDQASKDGWGGKDCTELPAFWSEKHRRDTAS